MDSMLCWDRRKTDARYDPALPNMTDLDFLLKLWAHVPGGYHLGTPLHDYVKVPTSMSNAPGFTERMIHSKKLILSRLAEGHYPMADDARGGERLGFPPRVARGGSCVPGGARRRTPMRCSRIRSSRC